MIRLEDLLRATERRGGQVVGPVYAAEFAAFSHDSRTIAPGELFVALRTEKADGHDFIADAITGGAAGVLCERPPIGQTGASPAGVTVVRVGGRCSQSSVLPKVRGALKVENPGKFYNKDVRHVVTLSRHNPHRSRGWQCIPVVHLRAGAIDT